MEKNIKYYLENPDRLKEVSVSEINQLLEDAPYSQPLRLLAEMKSNQVGKESSDYGTYFAEDYEYSTADVQGESGGNASGHSAVATTVAIGTAAIAVEPTLDIVTQELEEVSSQEPQIVSHSLADDIEEDGLEANILEENPNVELVNEVSHNYADEVLEDEVESELLELDVNEVHSFSEIDIAAGEASSSGESGGEDIAGIDIGQEASSLSTIDKILAMETEGDDQESITEESDTSQAEATQSEATQSEATQAETTEKEDVLDEADPNAEESVQEEASEENTASELTDPTEDTDEESRSIEEMAVIAPIVSKVRSSKNVDLPSVTIPSPNLGIDRMANLDAVEVDQPKLDDLNVGKKKKKTKKKSDKKSKSKKAKAKAKKKEAKQKKKEVKPTAKKNTDKKVRKGKDKTVKKVKGEVVSGVESTKLSGSKKIAKSSGRKVAPKEPKETIKYVIVNDTASKDMSMKDYDGVSNYASWLLDQESVNGDHKNAMAGKKTKGKSKKKKKKKSKVLKVAKDSIKKSDYIISEPLAAILASQGHTKKAKRMYEQLSLIFPEKSSYFAGQIEKLKK